MGVLKISQGGQSNQDQSSNIHVGCNKYVILLLHVRRRAHEHGLGVLSMKIWEMIVMYVSGDALKTPRRKYMPNRTAKKVAYKY